MLFRAYKLTLKQEEMYSSVDSGREHSNRAADDMRVKETYGDGERSEKIKYSIGKQHVV